MLNLHIYYKKKIIVTTYIFSGYICACIIVFEEESVRNAIFKKIQSIKVYMRSSETACIWQPLAT